MNPFGFLFGYHSNLISFSTYPQSVLALLPIIIIIERNNTTLTGESNHIKKLFCILAIAETFGQILKWFNSFFSSTVTRPFVFNPKSFAVWTMDIEPFRAKSTASFLNSFEKIMLFPEIKIQTV